MERRLAAILFADIVGYTALMAESEAKGLRVRERHRALVRPLVAKYHGEAIEARGDESLAVFPTALDAVNCALAIEEQLAGDGELRLHIGIHLGDFVLEHGEVSGDAVNIAARICSFAEAGVCVSGEVFHAVRNQPNVLAKPLGEHEFKNVGRSVSVYAVEGRAAAPAAGPRRRRVAFPAVAALAVVAIVVAALLTFGGGPPKESGPPLTSVAVLPFDDMSPGSDQKWLADGMAEELIETLSRIEALRVLARTSAFAMKGKDIATVGAELRVGSVVEGSVRRSDDQLRVTAQLIRVSDGSHLWSARYDRKLADVFAVQSEIARAIADAIGGELGIEDDYSWLSVHAPSDARAYELAKKSTDAMYGPQTEAGLRKAIEYQEQALRIDPRYADAVAGLGYSHLFLWRFYTRSGADLEKARAEAQRALAIDAANQIGLSLVAELLFSQYRWDEAREVVDRGLEHSPGNGGLRFNSGLLFASHGWTAEAIAELRRAVDLDPRSWFMHYGLGLMLLVADEYRDAVEALERAWDLGGVNQVRPALGYAYHQSGRDDDALEAVVRGFPPELAEFEGALRRGYAESGFLGLLRADIEWRVARLGGPCTTWDGQDGSASLALLGDAEAMFACLEVAIDRGQGPWFLKTFSVYDPYRSDPRFTALLERMNLDE